MAIYYLNVKTIGRGAGGKATSAAAYRAGERVRDERTGRVFDHSRRTDVMHKEIVIPAYLHGLDMSWVRDRSALWNAAELAERRSDARVAREYLVALPHELTPAQRLGLVRGFSQELADQHGCAVDFAIHAPRPHNDPRSYHAHLLTTTRELLPTGLGRKSGLDVANSERQARGLGTWVDEILSVRERWAIVTNEALLQANVPTRIDHRSLAAQGIDREPLPRIPTGAWHATALGKYSEIAERIRKAYHARVQQRSEPVITPAAVAPQATDLASVRHEARQNWLQFRPKKIEKDTALSQNEARKELTKGPDHSGAARDDDQAM